VVASVERFAYKGVASNLVTYLTEVVEMSTSAAAKSVSAWSGVTSMLPLLTAVLTDSYWDRYSTITASSLFYVFVSFLSLFLPVD
jgi:peptide/histidine transporter 3/4